jgi:hypothetical protein
MVAGYGITVQVVNDHGQPLGDVYLDYFDDQVKGMVSVGWDGEPSVVQVLVESVAAVRGTDLRERA